MNPSGGALNTITYTLVTSSNDSRWAIPRSDGTGKYDHVDFNWSSCPPPSILPACIGVSGPSAESNGLVTGTGTGLYEGSYYTYSYTRGVPITGTGLGSMVQPKYYTAYMGKHYSDSGTCYNAIDAQRTDIVNDGVYGRPPYVLTPPATSPYSTVIVSGTVTGTATTVDTTKETTVPVPWGGTSSTSACGPAPADPGVVPKLNDTSFNGKAITRDQRILMTTARLEKASFGGVYAGGVTTSDGVDTGQLAPMGCTLNDASNYLAAAKNTDATNNGQKTPCWNNDIVLVVDGQASGMGDTPTVASPDIDCFAPACAYNSNTNPSLTGCKCAAIMNAFNLASANIQTHVVVNAPATWSTRYATTTYPFLWNLAVAGSPNHDGTPTFGSSEDEIYKAVSAKIAASAYRFFYTTTAPVAGATTQDPVSKVVSFSNMLYDTSVSYATWGSNPGWQGNLRAFAVGSSVVPGWDAVKVATGKTTPPAPPAPANWTKRRILFGKINGTIEQVIIQDDGSISNANNLNSAGLGASPDEAQRIMQWLLGKQWPSRPELSNPTPLMGSITASTPIAVGQASANGLDGSDVFSVATWQRPQLVYVGADDGMLHAFFAQALTPYAAGEEAFAFIPNDMLPVIAKLYAQGGQRLSVEKAQHIFGLAASPKVKDMCVGTSCDGAKTAVDWHTVLVMGEGPGGNKPFALDITNVVDATHGLQLSTLTQAWSAASSGADAKWNPNLGETTSVPAFYFAGYDDPDQAPNRVLFASGYQINGNYPKQGLVIVNADAWSGKVWDTPDLSTMGTPSTSDSCTQTKKTTRALVADMAVARDYASAGTSQNLMAAYAVDTVGNTFQYVPHASTPVTLLYYLGCGQPLYFSPAVVQLDRVPKADTSAKHFIYLVQVTNSNLDPVTMPYSADYPGSQIVVTKLDGNNGPPVKVSSYNANGSGQVVLATDATLPSNRICIQADNTTNFTGVNNTKDATKSCSEVGATELPTSARPVTTPTVVLRSDGLGFQVITSWFDPTTQANDCSSGPFNYGKSYITVHEFGADGGFLQVAGLTLTNTVLTGLTFVGTGLFIDGITRDSAPTGQGIGETFSSMQSISNPLGVERYTRTTWTERVDL